LVRAIEAHAWDGAWYLRAFHDDGSALGSAANAEAQIDSLPQSWAVLTGSGDEQRARQALTSAWERLVNQQDGLTLLFTPPFDGAGPDPGYIAGYPPGVRENGGQYTHAAIWQAIAWARLGDGERALRLLQLLSPVGHAMQPERYLVEPYVLAADIYNLDGQVGRGGWTWYTGSAAWMYRAVVEEILGLKLRGAVLEFRPVFPADWERVGVRYRHGEAQYQIEYHNPDRLAYGEWEVVLDGERMPQAQIPLERGTESHQVRLALHAPGSAHGLPPLRDQP
jgi:cyclic beta-1,2-glucan synthetase